MVGSMLSVVAGSFKTQSAMTWCAGVVFSTIPARDYGFYQVPGVYMLCRREPTCVHILYIGQTTNIAKRLGPAHEYWDEALQLGMNEVHLHLLAKAELHRLAVEGHLVERYAPPLNRQRRAA